MAALPPPEIVTDAELYAWNALARGWDAFSGEDEAQWPERRRQFAAGLKQQLAINDQGEGFHKAACLVIERLEQC